MTDYTVDELEQLVDELDDRQQTMLSVAGIVPAEYDDKYLSRTDIARMIEMAGEKTK